MLCLGCSKLGKSDTYKGTDGVLLINQDDTLNQIKKDVLYN